MDTAKDFQSILASAVHDMKNSLGMLMNTIEEIKHNCAAENCSAPDLFPNLQYEAQRLNNNLIQLLTLYKIGNSRFHLNISHHNVSDFIEENIIQNQPLLDAQRVDIDIECNEDMFFFFDRELVSGVLNNILNNAFRYAGDKIAVSAKEEDDYLMIRIEDNGMGYPENMLRQGDPEQMSRTDFKTGSTGLGLYFSSIVAAMHENKGKKGFITLTNSGKYQGGCFTIFLP